MQLSMLLRRVGLACSLMWLMGCASINGKTASDPQDPWEPMNRAIFAFNEKADKYAMRPIAVGYSKIIPRTIRTAIYNFFSNIGDLTSVPQALLQGKGGAAAQNFGRFFINSTIGLAGTIDVATMADVKGQAEDFGQTFGWWGAGTGPYLVLPFLGPSNVRDGVGAVGDFFASPLYWVNFHPDSLQYGIAGIKLVDARAQLIGADKLLEQGTLDKYSSYKSFYLQRRKNLLYDGNPPADADEINILDDNWDSPSEKEDGANKIKKK